MKQQTQKLLKNTLKAGLLTATINGLGRLFGKNLGKGLGLGLFLGTLGVQSLMTTPAYALSESIVVNYARNMSQAANDQNIAKIARLIADDAIISLSRNGKTTNLDKEGYLQLLQKSWAKANNYHYQMTISDIVIAGNQARAQIQTIETWTQDGKQVVLTTSASKATLSQTDKEIVLSRLSAQVDIQ